MREKEELKEGEKEKKKLGGVGDKGKLEEEVSRKQDQACRGDETRGK